MTLTDREWKWNGECGWGGGRGRGQLISADAVIAIAAIAVIAGLAAGTAESALATASKHAEISSTLAEAVAASIADGVAISQTTHCAKFGNGTSDCASFECPGDVFSARRMMACGERPCLLEVLTSA